MVLGNAALVLVRPGVTDLVALGNDTFKWLSVRAITVTTGDLELRDDKRKAHWTIREEADSVSFINRKTGKKYRAVLEEVA